MIFAVSTINPFWAIVYFATPQRGSRPVDWSSLMYVYCYCGNIDDNDVC